MSKFTGRFSSGVFRRIPLQDLVCGWLLACLSLVVSGDGWGAGLSAPLSVEEVGRTLEINRNRSEVLYVPWPIKRVAVGQPAIADVEIVEPDQIVVLGMSLGSTDLIIWNEDGSIWRTLLKVKIDLEEVEAELHQILPNESISVHRINDLYVVEGVLTSANQASKMQDFFAKRELNHLDLTKVKGGNQIRLRVRVAEVNRTAGRAMGLHSFATDDSFFASTPFFHPVDIGVGAGATVGEDLPFEFLSDVSSNALVTLIAGFPKSNLEFFLRALSENQYLRILAEPTLVALSGEEASFLAGGEFPIPVVQSGTAGGSSAVTITYKEYGVRLRFLPVILGDGRIRLEVEPEVSELSDAGSVEIQGFRVPAMVTRRMSTTLELQAGQSFAMAGLLNNTVNSSDARIPLLGNLPVLGPLFRSTSYQSGESELVVLVTVNVVNPVSSSGDEPLPGALHVAPNDWEFFLRGRIEGSLTRESHAEGTKLAPHPFSELRGPGAWATYYED